MSHRNAFDDRDGVGTIAPPPAAFSPSPMLVEGENPVTSVRDRRVRPQAFVVDEEREAIRLVYSTDGTGGAPRPHCSPSIVSASEVEPKEHGGFATPHDVRDPSAIETVWTAKPKLERRGSAHDLETVWHLARRFGQSSNRGY